MFLLNSRYPLACAPQMLAHHEGLLLPKVRRQFAEFLQHPSLKRLGILYLPTCVGFGYGLYGGAISEPLRSRSNPIRTDNLRDPSHTSRCRNINLLPIDYPFGLVLGADSPARISLAQEPLGFRRQGISPCLSLLMSAFSLPIPPPSVTLRLHRLTERSATAH